MFTFHTVLWEWISKVWSESVSHSVISDSWDPMDYNTPGSSVHGILQARVLKWVVISYFRGSSQPRDWTHVVYTAGRFFIIWATREALKYSVHHTHCVSWELISNVSFSLKAEYNLLLLRYHLWYIVGEEVVIFFNYHFHVLSIKAMDSISQMPFFILMMASDKEASY